MQFEYQCLTVMTILFSFAWVPVSIGKGRSFGRKWLASNRDPLPGKELLPWAQRCDRAYNNLKDYFPAYVAAVVVLGLTSKFDQSTGIAALLYVIGRLGHYISYALGNVPLRAGFYFMAFLSNIFLLIKILL